MNEEKYTLINDYFNGLLDDTARQKVEDMVKTDPDFADAFHLQEVMEQWPAADNRRKQFEARLQSFDAAYFTATAADETAPETAGTPPAMRISFTRMAALAASFVLLIAAVWFMFRPQPVQYEQFAAHLPLHLTTRGNDQAEMSKAEQAFNSKQYSVALENLQKLSQSNPDDLTYQHFQAICLIELNRSAEARKLLEPIANGNSALRSEAVWYIGLSYLKEGNKEACKKMMMTIPADEFRYKDAQKIINNL